MKSQITNKTVLSKLEIFYTGPEFYFLNYFIEVICLQRLQQWNSYNIHISCSPEFIHTTFPINL